MKFGVFSVSMPEYDIEQTAKVISELGYDGVEWRVSNPAPKEAPEGMEYERRYWAFNKSTLDINNIDEDVIRAKELCDKYNVEMYSLTTYLKPHEAEAVEKVLKAAQKVGCKNVRVFPPNYDGKENYRVLFDRTIEELKVLEKLAEKYDVRINMEIHHGVIIPSASAAYRLVCGLNPKYIGIIYDPGNMVREGFENYKLGFELLGEYLSYVHVKNAKWERKENLENGAELWEPDWAPYKKGCGNLTKLLATLKEIGYDGYISVEDFSNEEDTTSKLKSNLEFLKSI